MKMLRLFAVAVALLTACAPVRAQWQTPTHSVPIGQGVGVIGFGNAAPGLAGLPFVSNGATSDPSFQLLGNGGFAAGAANTFKGTLNGTATADLPFTDCHGAGQAVQYTAGVGFSCVTLVAGGVVQASAGGTGATNLVGTYGGAQPAKIAPAVIGVNPGTVASLGGDKLITWNNFLTTDLSTATINTVSSPPQGGMLSGAMSVVGTTTDGTDVQLYMVSRNSDGLVALVGDNDNVYAGSTQTTISNGSASWTTGGPPSGYWNGARVRLTSSGTFPTGFAANTDYFVVNETNGQLSTTFGLAATFNGAAITATSTFTGAINALYGVQNHLNFIFGPGVWTVQRGLHFAFRWKWQWPGGGGIPDFTADPRGDDFLLTDAGQDAAFQVLSLGASTTFVNVDVSPILSNLNRIAYVRAQCTSVGGAGTAFVKAPGIASAGIALCEGPTSGTTAQYGSATVQADSQGHITYAITGGTRLSLWVVGGEFVDPR